MNRSASEDFGLGSSGKCFVCALVGFSWRSACDDVVWKKRPITFHHIFSLHHGVSVNCIFHIPDKERILSDTSVHAFTDDGLNEEVDRFHGIFSVAFRLSLMLQ